MSNMSYNPKDVFVSQKDEIGLNFNEKILVAVSNSFVIFDCQKHLTTLPTSSIINLVNTSYSSSWASSSISSSYSETASYVLSENTTTNYAQSLLLMGG